MSPSKTVISRPVLTVRVHAGLNAASLLAGLFAVGGMGLFSTANDLLKLRFPETQASLDVLPLSVNGIAGVTARPRATFFTITPRPRIFPKLPWKLPTVSGTTWLQPKPACTTVRLNPFIFTKWAA